MHGVQTLMPQELQLDATVGLWAELRSVRADLEESEANKSRLIKDLEEAEAENSRLIKDLEEFDAKCVGQGFPEAQQHRRRRALTTTPAPSPFTPVPTPFTPVPSTATPSATPSASPVPTTEGITTHRQLDNAIANTASSVIDLVIEAPFAFPTQAPILIESGRSVSIEGRSAFDGGRITLDGATQSRMFKVVGGSLTLAYLNLANGTTRAWDAGCADDRDRCAGSTIIVLEGSLTMSWCDIIGGRAFFGAIHFGEGGMTGDLFNVKFQGNYGVHGAAVSLWQGASSGVVVNFYACEFYHNTALNTATIFVGWSNIAAYLYDCIFENNHGMAVQYTSADGKIVRCAFRDNTGTTASWPGAGSVVYLGPPGTLFGEPVDVYDSVFERNVGGIGQPGGALCADGASSTWRNLTFVSNWGQNGGAFALKNIADVTLIGSSSHLDSTPLQGGAVHLDGGSKLRMFNSTISEPFASYGAHCYAMSESIFEAVNVTFRDGTSDGACGMDVLSGSSASFVDCHFINNHALNHEFGLLKVSQLASASLLRTVVADSSTRKHGGCFGVQEGGTLTIEDSDISGCRSGDYNDPLGGGFAYVNGDGTLLEVINSRISGCSAALKGSFAHVDGGTVRIAGSTITDTADGQFAIYVGESATDFSVQLDSNIVDSTFDICSYSNVLVQNVVGLTDDAVKNASVATCDDTSDYCLADSCIDASVGIDCICDIDGVSNPFPTDCMQSAVIEARLLIISTLLPTMLHLTSFCSPHAGPGSFDENSHISHFETARQDDRIRAFKRECET